MNKPTFIAGDWGTTHLRLYLCDAAGVLLARSEGEGAAVSGHAERFSAAVAAWDAAYGKLPAVMGGMVGSSIGWKEVPYMKCPAEPQAIARSALQFAHDGRAIAIAPGLKCTGLLGAPDVMRGEEVQILGALKLNAWLAQGRHIICLPGTHTKWVVVEDGAVTHFQTALAGELFQLLAKHSILARDSGTPDAASPAFAEGVSLARTTQGNLLHALFSTRSRVVTGAMATRDAASYLSGLIAGSDIVGAERLLQLTGTVHLVCTAELAALYGETLRTFGLTPAVIDGDTASLAGLTTIHAELYS